MQHLNDSDFYLPYDRRLIPRAKELRKNMTAAEKNCGINTSEPSSLESSDKDRLITLLLTFIV